MLHDWGSALGFHHARRHAANVRGIAFLEAIVRPMTWDEWPRTVRPLFERFRTPEVGWDLVVNRNAFIEQVLPGAILRTLTEEEMERYREPFRDPRSRKPVWRWPNEIPIDGEPADVAALVADYAAWLAKSDVPKLLLYARPGAILRKELVAWCRERLPNLTAVDVGPGLHFVQEDRPPRHRRGDPRVVCRPAPRGVCAVGRRGPAGMGRAPDGAVGRRMAGLGAGREPWEAGVDGGSRRARGDTPGASIQDSAPAS